MAFRPSTFASAAAMAAALSMVATPAAAAELPRAANAPVLVQTGDPGVASQYRYGRYDRYDRYGRYRHHRHRNRGIDTGDVIAGVVVLGALAAIIGSSRSRDRDRDRYEERREQVRHDRRDDRNYDSRGIENAVDMCIEQVERYSDRVESVHEARRAPDGWHVAGTLDNGSGWDCQIDNNGRVSAVDLGGDGYVTPGDGRYYGSDAAPGGGGQLSDAAYASARASTRTAADEPYSNRYDTSATYDSPAPAAPSADDPRPAYPGGPLPGEEGYDPDWQVDADLDNYGG